MVKRKRELESQISRPRESLPSSSLSQSILSSKRQCVCQDVSLKNIQVVQNLQNENVKNTLQTTKDNLETANNVSSFNKKTIKNLKSSLRKAQKKNKSSEKSRNLCFSPVPKVHEFDAKSPASRRLEVRRGQVESLSNEAVFKELLVRGIQLDSVDQVTQLHKEHLKHLFCEDLREELRVHDLDESGSFRTLQEKTTLLQKLLQRTRVFIAYGNNRDLPIDMTKSDIIKELKSRKVSVQGNEDVQKKLDFLDCEDEVDQFEDTKRSELIEFLENALLKEHAGMRIPGYEFGKTLVTSNDLVELQYWVTYGENAVIDLDVFDAETERVESLLRKKFKGPFIEVLSKELTLRNVEVDQKPDKEKPLMKRVNSLISYQSSDSDSHDAEETATIKSLFETLYRSGRWKNDYELGSNATQGRIETASVTSDPTEAQSQTSDSNVSESIMPFYDAFEEFEKEEQITSRNSVAGLVNA